MPDCAIGLPEPWFVGAEALTLTLEHRWGVASPFQIAACPHRSTHSVAHLLPSSGVSTSISGDCEDTTDEYRQGAQNRRGWHYVAIDRFSIPQKLSNKTLSSPWSHRTCTAVSWFAMGKAWILKASAGCSTSSSSSFSRENLSFSILFCFRLADRDQTFPLAAPIPVARDGRNCQRRSRGRNMLFKRWAIHSWDGLWTVKV